MPEESPTPRHLNGGLIFIVIFGMIFFVWVLTSDIRNFSQRVRHGKWKNAQKKFEHPPNPVVYVCMNIFGGGETRHANAETSLIFGEISEVRQPASFSL